VSIGWPVAHAAAQDTNAPVVRAEAPLTVEEFKRQAGWRAGIALVPHPKKGCFVVKFPSKEWQECRACRGGLCVAAARGRYPAGRRQRQRRRGQGSDRIHFLGNRLDRIHSATTIGRDFVSRARAIRPLA
jgi:hypothetical protein